MALIQLYDRSSTDETISTGEFLDEDSDEWLHELSNRVNNGSWNDDQWAISTTFAGDEQLQVPEIDWRVQGNENMIHHFYAHVLVDVGVICPVASSRWMKLGELSTIPSDLQVLIGEVEPGKLTKLMMISTNSWRLCMT